MTGLGVRRAARVGWDVSEGSRDLDGQGAPQHGERPRRPLKGARSSGAKFTPLHSSLAPISMFVLLIVVLVMNINAPLWDDEAATMSRFVLRGWSGVMSADYSVNNHRLFSLLTLATTEVFGTYEYVIRLWSIIPATLLAVVLFRWLDRRMGRVAALIGTALLIFNAEFIDLGSQGRGYGLAYLGWGLLVLSGLDFQRDGRRAHLWLASSGATIAVFTYPLLALPVAITYTVLWAQRPRDVGPLLHLTGIGFASLLWYRDALVTLVGSPSGFSRHPLLDPAGPGEVVRWLFRAGDIAPFTWTAGIVAAAPFALLAVAGIVAMTRAGEFRALLVVVVPPALTMTWAWLDGVAIWDRYTSYFTVSALLLAVRGSIAILERPPNLLVMSGLTLLVAVAGGFFAHLLGPIPGYSLLAITCGGIVWGLTSLPDRRVLAAGTIAYLVTVAVFGIALLAIDRRDTPLQDFRSIAQIVDREEPRAVVASYPVASLVYYLGPDVEFLNTAERPNLVPRMPIEQQRSKVCNGTSAVVVIFNHYKTDETLDTNCLRSRADANLDLVRMVRGGAVEVWSIE